MRIAIALVASGALIAVPSQARADNWEEVLRGALIREGMDIAGHAGHTAVRNWYNQQIFERRLKLARMYQQQRRQIARQQFIHDLVERIVEARLKRRKNYQEELQREERGASRPARALGDLHTRRYRYEAQQYRPPRGQYRRGRSYGGPQRPRPPRRSGPPDGWDPYSGRR